MSPEMIEGNKAYVHERERERESETGVEERRGEGPK
jgi:hypothetical protein